MAEVFRIRGKNGTLVVYPDKVAILRDHLLARAIRRGGDREIYVRNITSIELKRPGLTSGFLHFSHAGGRPFRDNAFSIEQDDNTITFNTGYDEYLEAKEYVERRIEEAHAPPAATSGSVADELQKLAALRDQGILTDAEFQAEKARVLGRKRSPNATHRQ